MAPTVKPLGTRHTRRDATIDSPHPARRTILAKGLLGDPTALEAATGLPPAYVATHRALPALASRWRQAQIEIAKTNTAPQIWRAAEAATAAHWLLIESTRASVGRALTEAGVRWLPIKGGDVADRFYDRPQERPTSDLDVLVPQDAFEDARQALVAEGWVGLSSDPRVERYRAEEGYAWPATAPSRPLLEVHFRLWGLVPEALAGRIVDEAEADPDLGGHRPTVADAYLLAAIHAGLGAPPRPILDAFDLHIIARGEEPAPFVAAILDRVDTFGLALPVALAASDAARLFDDEISATVAEKTALRLRLMEARLLERAMRNGFDTVGTADIVLARLLARRPSRAGWRSAVRRVWAHAGVVAAETPGDWSWPRRRVAHLGQQLGLRSPE